MNGQPPKLIGRYEVLEKLGQGGMGAVYLGFDPYNNRRVALKVAIEGDFHDDELKRKYRKLFFNEARIAGMLDHPNILSLYDAGIDEDRYYIVMEYIKGSKTLKEYCSPDNLLPPEKVVEIIFKCCRALDYAHRLGVIHRDIKPSNLMLTENMDVKIGDFGIALINRAGDTQTQVMGLMGSPCYMSPEQVKEEPLTGQTDIFSLGSVMYELLTGKSPFYGANVSSVVRKVLYHDQDPPRLYRSDLARALEVIVMKALSKKTSERYKTGTHLASDLRITNLQINDTAEEINHKEKFTILRNLAFFREFHDSELWEVLNAITWKEIKPRDPVCSIGEMEDTFYIIVEGEAAVEREGREMATLKGGDCFGEISYLTGSKRTSNMIAASDASILEVNSAAIEQLSPACQLRFHKMFLKKLIERLSKRPEGLD